MSRYNYNNYYDPVGSQANQPSGYTYLGNTGQQQPQSSNATQYASSAASNYQTGYNQSYADTYGGQQYASTTQSQQPSTASTSRAANTLSSLRNAQGYAQSALANQQPSSDTAGGYDNTYYNPSNAFAQSTSRTHSNESPLYNTAASTFGRLSLPDQSQTTSNTYANNQYQSTSTPSTKYQNAPSSAGLKNRSYRTAYTQEQSQTQPPQRYASPFQAVQAQGHAKNSSTSSNHQPSPQMNVQQLQSQHQRQQSAPVEPSAMTVDPSQVYDFRAEQQRKAEIEAVKRRQREAEAAQRKAEEDAETARKEEEERVEREQREAEETASKAAEAEAKKKAAQERKNEQRRKAREEKRQSKTAATALTQMASGSGGDAGMMAMMGIDESVAPANAEEAEMRAMFKKMREFNAKNPQMLAKLWEEERTAHATQASSPQPAKPAQTAPPKQPKADATGPRPFTKPVAQASPAAATPTQRASATLWPPHKKGSLAEAAAKWLNGLAENRSANKTIGKETVLKILDTNPSYVQLCESIEKNGIKFERSALAKELLKAVPDGLRNNNANKPVTPSAPVTGVAANGSSGSPANTSQERGPGRPGKDGPLNYGVPHAQRSAGPVNYQTPSFTSLSDAARAVHNMDATPSYPPHLSNTLTSAITSAAAQPAVQSPYFDQPISADNPVQALTPEMKAEEKPEEPRRPPANKEEAARKRTFTDLVDLSKDDSDDDEGPPRKIQQPLGGPTNGALKHAPSNEAFRKPMSFDEFRRAGTAGIAPGQGALHPFAPARSWMNFGQRPTIPGQTLATPAPVPATKTKGPTEEQKQYERMRGKMLVEPIMRDRVARKSKYDSRTIARDVLLATGRHPDMRALNAHLNTMQKLLGDHGGVIDGAGNKSDLATVKWDIIDPGEPAEDAKAKAKSASAGREKKSTDADGTKEDDDDVTDVDDEGDWATGRAEEALRKIRKEGMDMEQALLEVKDPMVRKQIRNRIHVQRHKEKYGDKRRTKRASEVVATDTAGEQSDSQQHLDSVQEQLRGSESGPARGRGRPPKNRRDSNLPTSNNATPARSTPQPRPSAASSASAKMSGGAPVGYAAFRELDANGNPIKKKGRPVGWRKSVNSREAQGLTPNKSLSQVKPSRQRQSTGPTAAKEDLVQPEYQVYKCRWTDCTAELDNLDRLKKHVVKLHGGANDEGDFECLWRSCKFAGKHVDANGKARDGDVGVTSFETMDHWMKHVDKEHLNEVAWKLGDGPRGGSVTGEFDLLRSDA